MIDRVRKILAQHVVAPLYLDLGGGLEDTVLLAGTERGGTTWVADIINYDRSYRMLFEPFWANKVDLCAPFSSQQYLRPESDDLKYLDPARTILEGKVRNQWVDKYHRRFFARKRLVKDVRINLLLGWMHAHFPNIPKVLLLRHPCAVALSQMKNRHNFGSIQRDLLSQPELCEDHLEPFMHLLQGIDDDFEQRISRWCIQTYVPLRQLRSNDIHVAFYENLCTDPEHEIGRLFEFLGRSYDSTIWRIVNRPSPVTSAHSEVMQGGDLIDGWRRHITTEQISRAVQILELFGLADLYGEGSLPNREALMKFSLC